LAYAGKKALVKVAGTAVSMTDEATTVIAAGGGVTANTQYQITATSKQIIDINSTITVKVGGSPVTSGYTVDTLRGVVIFDTSSVRTVTVSGKYVPTSTAAECHEWSLKINQDTEDTTAFQDDWIKKTPTLKSAEGSLSRWFNVDKYFQNALVSGLPVVIELYPQDTLNPDRVWGVLNSSEMSAAVDGASEESVSFESTNKMLMSYA
jgi:hypothetical protein